MHSHNQYFDDHVVQNRPARCVVVAGALLCVHAALLARGAYLHSPTLNEPGHLVAGLRIWHSGTFDVYKVNPPLVHAVSALPVMLTHPKLSWNKLHQFRGLRPEFALGEDFVAANGLRSFWQIAVARWACIPFSVIGGCICFFWASTMYGQRAGLLAVGLWCFNPDILGHGQLITADVAAASLGLAAGYAFWTWLQRPSWARTIVSGIVLGIAELAKTTLTIYVFLWPMLWILFRLRDRATLTRAAFFRETAMLAAWGLLTLYVINLGYLFEGTGTPLGEYRFNSVALTSGGNMGQPARKTNRFASTWVGTLPVPLPASYVTGIDLQKRDFEAYKQPSYLAGAFQAKGWWYYYLYGLAVKTPLGTGVLFAMAIGTVCFSRPPVNWRGEAFLLASAAAVFLLVSSQYGFSQHMRYILPVYPYLFVWVSRVASPVPFPSRSFFIVAAGALLWSIASSLCVYPHSLSYFNELGGGPKGGADHLIHSNIDWGQDLLELKRWLTHHPEVQPLQLAYFGYFDPRHAGIQYSAPAVGRTKDGSAWLEQGWYAISINFVKGFPYFIYTGDGSKRMLKQDELILFQKYKPFATAGYSIYIYHVEKEHEPQGAAPSDRVFE